MCWWTSKLSKRFDLRQPVNQIITVGSRSAALISCPSFLSFDQDQVPYAELAPLGNIVKGKYWVYIIDSKCFVKSHIRARASFWTGQGSFEGFFDVGRENSVMIERTKKVSKVLLPFRAVRFDLPFVLLPCH